MPTVVHPFVGVGELRLGMTRRAVKASIGPADAIWHMVEEPQEQREAWEYPDVGWSLNFDEEDDWRLTGVDVLRPSVAGLELAGLTEAALLEAWASSGQPPLVEDGNARELDVGIWYCDALGLTLWTEDGVFDYLTVEPRWSEDGETILWPDSK